MKMPQVKLNPIAGLISAAVITGGTLVPPAAIAQTRIEVEMPQPAQIGAANSSCSAALDAAISQIIDQPRFASAQWGVLIESLSSGSVLYSRNADQYFIPASNIKLLTTATALQAFGSGNPGYSADFVNRIRVINRDSNNATADALFWSLGGQPQIQSILSMFGIDSRDYRQVDGSGLSRYNMVKPTALVSVLRGMRFANGQDLFFDSLPVGGVSGTLRRRFIGTPAEGRVRAKTGTLRGVRALSGYLDTPRGESFVFSILVNQPGQSGEVMLNAIDQIVLQLTRLDSCG